MFNRIVLKQRIIIILIIFSSLPSFIFASSLYANLYEIRESEKEDLVYDNIINNANGLNEWIDSKINLLKSVNFLVDTLNHDSELELNDLVERINNKSSNLEEVYVFKKESKISLSENANIAWYLKAPRSSELIVSKIHKNSFNSDVISFAYDIEFKDENYVLAIDFTISELKNELKKLYYKNGVGSLIVFNGTTIYIDEEIKSIKLDKIIYNDTSGVIFTSGESTYMGVNKKIENSINLIMIEDFSNNLYEINKLRFEFYKLMIFLFFISILLSIHLSHRLVNPIENIKKELRKSISNKSNIAYFSEKNYKYLNLYSLYKDMVMKNKNMDYWKLEIFQKSEQFNREYERNIIELEKTLKTLKEIELDIKYSNKKYDNLFNNIKDFIWTIDVDGNITSANNVFIEKLGYKKYEILGSKFKSIVIQNEKVLDIEEFIFNVLKEDQIGIAIRLKKKMFSEYEIVIFNSKRIVENGKLLGVQFVARTIIDKEILEKKMYKRNKELEFIKEISRTLTNSRNLDDLLSSIANKIKNLIEIGLCSIWLLGEEGYLELKASSNKSINIEDMQLIDIKDDLLGQAILKSKVIKINSFETSNNINYEIMKNSFENIEEMIFIPLENSGTPSGVISIGVGSKLSELDIDILSAFASQSSVAIEKAKLYEKLKLDYFNTIKVLATAVEAKDTYTEGHSIRVSKFAVLIGEKINMSELEIEEIAISGILHDIGKIGIDDTILTKAGKLSTDEYSKIRKHPEIGARIINPIDLSERIVEGVLYHHITYDGKGYPNHNVNIKSKIPYIIGVADALDAMTSNRSYSKKKTIADAIDELVKFKGTQFSPEIVDAVSEIYQSSPEKLDEISDFETI